MSTDLITALRAALDEREATAQAASGGPWMSYTGPHRPWMDRGHLTHTVMSYDQPVGDPPIMTASWMDSQHIAANDPAFVLADIAAKRKLIDAYEAAAQDGDDYEHGQHAASLYSAIEILAEAYGVPERCNAAGDAPNSLGTERCDLPAGHDGRHYEGNTTWPNRSAPRA